MARAALETVLTQLESLKKLHAECRKLESEFEAKRNRTPEFYSAREAARWDERLVALEARVVGSYRRLEEEGREWEERTARVLEEKFGREERNRFLQAIKDRQLSLEDFELHLRELASRAARDMGKVFVVHGHDEANLNALVKRLKEWKLDPVVLWEQPGQALTIIEKLEEVAESSSFAVVLLTPDDVVRKGGDEHQQPRPNVFFELGWFSATLGRRQLCIVREKSIAISSDLAAIGGIEFSGSLKEKDFKAIRRDLRKAGVLETRKSGPGSTESRVKASGKKSRKPTRRSSS